MVGSVIGVWGSGVSRRFYIIIIMEAPSSLLLQRPPSSAVASALPTRIAARVACARETAPHATKGPVPEGRAGGSALAAAERDPQHHAAMPQNMVARTGLPLEGISVQGEAEYSSARSTHVCGA